MHSGTAPALRGHISVPGDKSISHRALILGALAVGETRIAKLLRADDVMRTLAAVRALGACVEDDPEGATVVRGVGVGGFAEPADVLDLGNSGTGTRLLIGALASQPVTAQFTGDASLRSRPMARVMTPLERIGARFVSRAGGRLPLAVIGAEWPVPMSYRLPVPSVQVKSAILLAGLNAPGETTVIEPSRTRDHTELMLRHFGAEVRVEDTNEGVRAVTVTGQPELAAAAVIVPGDPSSAAFPAVAALIVPDSEITIEGVGVNPLRTGLYDTLAEMGADISFGNRRTEAGEPVADITLRAGALKGVDVPADRAPSMIDEYPILAVAAAFARGRTRMFGLSELRVKESDRLAAIAEGLAACGVRVEVSGDDLTVEGDGGAPAGGATVKARDDHRIAMAFLVLGLAAKGPVAIDDGRMIATSFPEFAPLMNRLGAAIG
jgi:3-phosphoshikimate 1-carboxyvinyltransferase